MQTIKLANKLVGKDQPCFIIAEAGVNHDGNIEKAKRLIDIAKKAGVDAVKFQTWITEENVTKDAEQAEYQIKNTGKRESQYELLKKLELSFNQFRELKKYADQKKIIFLSTGEDERGINFLDKLGVPAFKIGSGDLTNDIILKIIAKKNKPIILSTGMANLEEVKHAVQIIYNEGNKNLILLHCTSNYPTKLKDVNLKAMLTLEKEFNVLVGYSDHTKGINTSVAALCLGASVIEKHFTYDKNALGPDHKASLSPSELKLMVDSIRKIEKLDKKRNKLNMIKDIKIILGKNEKVPVKSEILMSRLVRKSIVAKKNIKKGEKLTKEILTVKRPNKGLSPDQVDRLLNKRAKRDIKKNEFIFWNMLE